MKEFTIFEKEFYCDNKNTTLLKINKDWLSEILKSHNLKNGLFHLTTKVFENKAYFKKQKIIALINLVKDIRKECGEENKYQLNLVVRNLKTYQTTSEYIRNEDLMIALYSLITLAFNNSYNKLIQSLYNPKA